MFGVFSDSTMLSAVIPGCSNHGWNIAVNLTLLRSSIPNYRDEMQIYLGNASCKGGERRGFLVYDNNFYECMTRKKVLFALISTILSPSSCTVLFNCVYNLRLNILFIIVYLTI